MSGDTALQRAHAYLEDARDTSIDPASRCEALDAARSAILDARRARVQPQLLLPIFKDVCTAAASDSSYQVRCIVPRAVEDLCLREMKIFVPTATPFLVRSLHDNNVMVAKRAVRALTTLFRKLVGFVVSVGVSDTTFPEARLSAWLQMQVKAISLIQSQDEGLRKAATKFAETVVLAFSYSGGAASPDHFTLDYILKTGSTCPLLDAAALEEEGVRCVKAVAQLIHAGLDGALTTVRPDGKSSTGLPPLSFMTAISVLSNLVRRRRKLLQSTLPPLLVVVTGITGPTRPPSPAFHSLTEGQKQSIISVLRFSILALRAYPHTRSGRAGTDVNLATNHLSNYEKEQESRRKEIASSTAAKAKLQNTRSSASFPAAPPRHAPVQIQEQKPPTALPQQRRPDPNRPWPRPPAKDAFLIAQNLSRSMPHKEVVNFIMTRLLLNIPPPATVPGAVRPRNLQSPSAPTDEPVPKRPRRSRFGAKDEDLSKQPSAPPKKVVAVRKVAPPVIAAKLSSEAADKLVTMCCRRVMTRELEASVSGAGPLRTQLLARLLASLSTGKTTAAQTFCDEACTFIATGIHGRVELALAWLHSLLIQEEFLKFTPNEGEAQQMLTTVQPHDEKALSPGESKEAVKDEEMVDKSCADNVKSEQTLVSAENAIPNSVKQAREEQSTLSAQGSDTVNAVSAEHDNGADATALPKNQAIPQPSDGVKNQVQFDSTGLHANQDGEENVIADSQEELEDEEYVPLVVGEAYQRVFLKLLLLLKERSNLSSEVFSSVVTGAPVLPAKVLEMLDGLCKDASRTKLGLQTLRDVVVERSGEDGKKCLTLLLQYTHDEDEVLRGPAIRLVANKIFVESSAEISRLIEDHAVGVLSRAMSALAEANPRDIDVLDRSSLLLTALCGQKHELLVSMAMSYAEAGLEGKKVLLRRARDLAGHLGMSAKPILDLLGGTLMPVQHEEDQSGCASDKLDELALEILRALLKKFGKPTNEIVEAACRRYETSRNTDFIVAVLPGLQREALLRYLAPVVEKTVQSEAAEAGVQTAVLANGAKEEAKSTAGFKDVISLVMNARPPALSPAELLVELHKIKPTTAVSTAIRACFEVKVLYKQVVVAQAVQQLIGMTVTPDLFMRTVHLSKIFHPEMENYLTTTVMKRLIEKKVWVNNLLWEGFLKYCAESKKKSLVLLLSLPPAQLEDALEKQPVLTVLFYELLSNPKNAKKIQPKYRKVISAAITKSSKSKT